VLSDAGQVFGEPRRTSSRASTRPRRRAVPTRRRSVR
jgi:hypothetical protein